MENIAISAHNSNNCTSAFPHDSSICAEVLHGHSAFGHTDHEKKWVFKYQM